MIDISEVNAKAHRFKSTLDKKKLEINPVEFGWYPYGTLNNFHILNKLLSGGNRNFLETIEKGDVIADIGAADGDTAFFLESMGYRADVIDYGPTNFNGCNGVKLLKERLNSQIGIHEIDLDSQFQLPAETYSLVFFLGILYHLKNPYFVLEALAKRAKYAFISTRVTRFNVSKKSIGSKDGVNRSRVEIADVPCAYLVAADETNHDATNFWMFSNAGLRRILDRCGWDILDYANFGNTAHSDPATNDGDERAFCYVRSRLFNG